MLTPPHREHTKQRVVSRKRSLSGNVREYSGSSATVSKSCAARLGLVPAGIRLKQTAEQSFPTFELENSDAPWTIQVNLILSAIDVNLKTAITAFQKTTRARRIPQNENGPEAQPTGTDDDFKYIWNHAFKCNVDCLPP